MISTELLYGILLRIYQPHLLLRKAGLHKQKIISKQFHYGPKKLVYPDKVKHVFQISRYVEYIDHGKMKPGILLMQYYTDSVDAILQHYKNTQTSYCYLLDDNSAFLYHPFYATHFLRSV